MPQQNTTQEKKNDFFNVVNFNYKTNREVNRRQIKFRCTSIANLYYVVKLPILIKKHQKYLRTASKFCLQKMKAKTSNFNLVDMVTGE